MSFALLVISLGAYWPRTEVGKQCPTAPVQKVAVTVATRDCCGKVRLKTELRAPKLGEKGFLQCQCEERKANDRSECLKSGVVSFTWILPEPAFQVAHGSIYAWSEPPLAASAFPSPPGTPATPPPDYLS